MKNSTLDLINFIETKTPCLFVKYGDGEFNSANFYYGSNCDGTPYTKNLGIKLRESFVYNSKCLNSMIGAWHDTSHKNFWEALGNTNVNWVDFHTILIDNSTILNKCPNKHKLFKTIKETNLNKIYVANQNMQKAKDIFNIDYHVIINPSNWFELEYNKIFNNIKTILENNPESLLLFSAGMGSKYLISELHKLFPKSLYLDVGSGFDKICTGIQTRSYNPDYGILKTYLSDII